MPDDRTTARKRSLGPRMGRTLAEYVVEYLTDGRWGEEATIARAREALADDEGQAI
jgi:hypothetical protein